MKSSRFVSFVFGVVITFGAFCLQNAVAQENIPKLPPGISGADHDGIYDDGKYVYVVQPKTGNTLMISKTTRHRLGNDGEMIPEAFRFQGARCEIVRSKTWK